jgi:hypothetical protein
MRMFAIGNPLEIQGLWAMSAVRNSKQLESTTFRTLDPFPSSGEGRVP